MSARAGSPSASIMATLPHHVPLRFSHDTSRPGTSSPLPWRTHTCCPFGTIRRASTQPSIPCISDVSVDGWDWDSTHEALAEGTMLGCTRRRHRRRPSRSATVTPWPPATRRPRGRAAVNRRSWSATRAPCSIQPIYAQQWSNSTSWGDRGAALSVAGELFDTLPQLQVLQMLTRFQVDLVERALIDADWAHSRRTDMRRPHLILTGLVGPGVTKNSGPTWMVRVVV